MIVSVIVPAFNRLGPLRDTLQTAHRALAEVAKHGLGNGELILVDDGSTPALDSVDLPVADVVGVSQHILRQTNSGSIVARQTGLAAARGRYVQFLDSDDLLAPEKLSLQIAAMEATGATASFGTLVDASKQADGRLEFAPANERAARILTPAQWLLSEQPAPHVPMFRRDAIADAIARPILPLQRRADAAGDIWLYLNCALMPGVAVEVPLARAAIGVHDELRYSLQWEKLAYTSLLLMEAFMAETASRNDATVARQLLGVAAFRSWRRLPIDFAASYQRRLLSIYRAAPKGPLAELDGRRFGQIAGLIGPMPAAQLLRRWRNHRYASCRSVDDATLQRIVESCQP
ncbi:hypothetical protein C7S18_23105 [Ahniella affigens]|uniref:Glycosyltransferase 2-like domain-containing protein n=1 Tax=Ahniella affigens TaxID=2021234 RepID=A0A2P1PYH5_9GAMM|nr:glycosyltransferase family 2 protein [Ahniella affigens]AVP99888.1 hypothetical protein C7S18_23105 [Ahniella affigens]